jgi:uncharacterized protein YbjT (DUF2867 family)
VKFVVIGGTGLIGSTVVACLREEGEEAVAASPDSGVDTLTGEGLAEALQGASVVVDVSNSPSFEDQAVMEFFTTSTTNLLAAEADGVVEIAGPEEFRFDEFIRRGLEAKVDPRTVVTDPKARYFGALLQERTLVAGCGAHLGEIRFGDWLAQPTLA